MKKLDLNEDRWLSIKEIAIWKRNMTQYLTVFQNENIPQAYGISGEGLNLVNNNGIFMKNSKCMQNNEIFLQG